jgi:hypothetical protein
MIVIVKVLNNRLRKHVRESRAARGRRGVGAGSAMGLLLRGREGGNYSYSWRKYLIRRKGSRDSELNTKMKIERLAKGVERRSARLAPTSREYNNIIIDIDF